MSLVNLDFTSLYPNVGCSIKDPIGHHFGKELTQEDKEKIRKQYGKWRTVHNIK